MMELQDLKNKFGIIGNSPGLNFALTTAEKVAPTDLSVLINGESGVGKEIFSHIIHQLSPRKHEPFIAINCGAIPEGTIDSELFGHEKGSFTGAADKRMGYFESVNKGTIFLDEIGEMPLSTQSRLLRLLQNGEFIKVGASKIQQVDVRVIAATNADLMQAVQEGKFREDLYYRLNTVPINVPPLRERGNDILLLFRKFCVDFCEKNNIKTPELTEASKQVLLSYRWPGNIRQLKNVAEQICLLADSPHIEADTIEGFLPNNSKSLTLSNSNFQDNSAYPNDISIKMLVDIKKDLNDMKRLFFEMSQSSKDNFEQYSELNEQLETTINGLEKYNGEHTVGNYSKSAAIELPASNKVIHIDKNQDSLNLGDMEKKYIEIALKKNKGKRKYAAQELGISERTLYRKIIDYNIEE